jgi:hypothetical protein
LLINVGIFMTTAMESDAASSVESEDPVSDSDSDASSAGARPNHQYTSTTFIEIIHHPHSKLEPEFIFRDLPAETLLTEEAANTTFQRSQGKPWAPFRTRADFEFAETVIKSATGTDTIDALIKGIQNSWTDPGHSRITFHDVNHLNQSMEAARKYVVQVR